MFFRQDGGPPHYPLRVRQQFSRIELREAQHRMAFLVTRFVSPGFLVMKNKSRLSVLVPVILLFFIFRYYFNNSHVKHKKSKFIGTLNYYLHYKMEKYGWQVMIKQMWAALNLFKKIVLLRTGCNFDLVQLAGIYSETLELFNITLTLWCGY